MESVVVKLATCEISYNVFLLVIVAEQTGLSITCCENLEDRFSRTEAQFVVRNSACTLQSICPEGDIRLNKISFFLGLSIIYFGGFAYYAQTNITLIGSLESLECMLNENSKA